METAGAAAHADARAACAPGTLTSEVEPMLPRRSTDLFSAPFSRKPAWPSLCLALALVTLPASVRAQQDAPRQAAGSAPAVSASRPVQARNADAGTPLPSSDTVATAAPARALAGLHELSPWSMLLAADVVVKVVMLGLAFASLVTWTILVGKTAELMIARRRLTRTLDQLRGARSLAQAQRTLPATSLLSELAGVARDEMDMSGAHHDAGVKERAALRFAHLVRAETQSVRRGMGALATIGATAPFVGLFGTVWGIMNSFIGISKSQTTNLAVVAPGIAEALLATAIGLVAAIPAVIIYNHFSRATRSLGLLIAEAASTVTCLLSRELERPHVIARAAE